MQTAQFVLAGLALALAPSAPLLGACSHSGHDDTAAAASLDQVVARIDQEGRKYIFVGERHGVAPVKRFAVDLANALAERGHDVGLYVEGFRTDCAPRDAACPSLARLFNADSFLRLLDESRVPVHALDPPERDGRAARMAAVIAAGTESIRIVLVGRSHVVHADDPTAELWVYGGSVRYPNPGDVVEAFPRAESLTFALGESWNGGALYALRADGCGADYSVLVAAQ